MNGISPGLALALVLPALGSCNALLGIDDVSRAEAQSPGAGGSTGGGGDRSDEPDASDSGGSGASDGGATQVGTSGIKGAGGNGGVEPNSGDGGAPSSGGSSGSGATSSSAGKAATGQPLDCDLPGSYKDDAYDLGELGPSLLRCPSDAYVDATQSDFYRFELAENATLRYTFDPKNSGHLLAKVYNDAPQLSLEDYVFTVDTTTTASDQFYLEKGVYYLRVATAYTPVLYGLRLSAELYEPHEPEPAPGGDTDHALDLGVVGELRKIGGYVGKKNPEDYYRFKVLSNATITFSMEQVRGNVMYGVYEYTNQFNRNEYILQSGIATATESAYRDQILAHGDYLIVVSPYPAHAASLYTLAISVKAQ